MLYLISDGYHDNIFGLSAPQDMPSILDWPLPQPAYDEVATELEDQSEDQEVHCINKGLTEDAPPSLAAAATGGRSESQSADLFQELQREVRVHPTSERHVSASANTFYC